MNKKPTSQNSEKLPSKPAAQIAVRITATWLLFFPVICWAGNLLCTYQVLERISFSDYCLVSTANLLVGYFSLVPMFRVSDLGGGDGVETESKDKKNAKLLGVLMSGMTIRFLGTIALVVVCRYHIGSAEQTLAAATIFWFALLTSVSVLATAKEVNRARFSVGLAQNSAIANSTVNPTAQK